jgi:outer membrane protein TolC
MRRSRWFNSAVCTGLAGLSLAGCTGGSGRTALRSPPLTAEIEEFQTVALQPVVQLPPAAALTAGEPPATDLLPRSEPALAYTRSRRVEQPAAADVLLPRVAIADGRIQRPGIRPTTAPTRRESGIARVGGVAPDRLPSSPTASAIVRAGGILAPEPVSVEAEPTPLAPQPVAVSSPIVDERTQYPIDLPTTLSLIAGQNPEVGFAQWRVQEAYARLDQAQALWLPSIQVGVNYHRHDGNLQNIEGRIVDINRSSLNAGLGAGATAAGTIPNPGLVARFHLADAIFQPQIAERTAWARSHAADAVTQDRLLDAALGYLELLEAAQAISIAEDELLHTSQLAEVTDAFASTGQGLQSDADRLQTELALRRNGVIRAQERFAVASARLAEIISLDCRYHLMPCEVTIAPIDVVALETPHCQLITTGLSHRAELRESRCLVAEACERLNREKYAPLVPSVLLGMSYGGFGGGTGGTISRLNDRADFDALAMWEVRNLGFGEAAARQTAGAQIEQVKFQQVRIMDRIAREVAESLAQCQSRQQQISVAEGAIATAQASYERNLDRIRQGQGLPIEALQSIQALAAARREYLTSVMDYNEAQFRLQRALGWPCG